MQILSRMALAAFVITPALPAQGTPGFYVETRVTTVSKGGAGNTTTRTHVERSWMSATCSRAEGQEFLGDSMAYLLVTGSPARALQVLPRDRVVYTLDSAARRAIASEAAAAAKLNAPQVQFKPKSLGDGGSILGHKTRKYESEITTRASAGRAEIARAPTTIIHWVAEDPADSMVAAYRASHGRLLGAERLGTAGGLLLRSESRSQRQRDVTQETTRDVLVWRREVIPASRCAVPSGYRTTDLLADLRTKQAATAEMQRLSRSTNPADRARAKLLADSLFKEIRRTQAPTRSLRDDPRAVMIDGKATKKP